jgi:hypothetical protein
MKPALGADFGEIRRKMDFFKIFLDFSLDKYKKPKYTIKYWIKGLSESA